MKEEDLYSEEFVRSPISYTGGLFYKISEKVRGIIKSGIPIDSIFWLNYATYIFNKKFVLILIAIITLVIIAGYIHMYLTSMLNSRGLEDWIELYFEISKRHKIRK